MRRDLNKVRDILLKIEASPNQWIDERIVWPYNGDPKINPEESHWSQAELGHIALLKDAGFIERREKYDEENMGWSWASEIRLTFSGHDYLDAIRDEGIWKKTQEAVAETGGNASLEIAKTLAVGFLKKKISQHTDIEL